MIQMLLLNASSTVAYEAAAQTAPDSINVGSTDVNYGTPCAGAFAPGNDGNYSAWPGLSFASGTAGISIQLPV